MPFDGTNYKVKVAPLQTGLAGLKQISDALRFSLHDHVWDFTTIGGIASCGSYGCATGLASALWPEEDWPGFDAIARVLELPPSELSPIFGLGFPSENIGYPGKRMVEVTPHNVADAIDHYIAQEGGAPTP